MMKKILLLLMAFHVGVLFLLSFSSCGLVEFETSGNGKLDGNWHLETVDTLSTGGVLNLKKDVLYWAVESKLLVMSGHSIGGFVCTFTYEGNILSLGQLRANQREQGDPVIEDVATVSVYGVNAFEEQFRVLEIDRRKLVLQTEKLRLTFKKM